jgi:uncharacterized membrane protein
MPKTTAAGHPLHPQLIVLPAGLLPFSFVMDVMHLVTGKQAFADAAYYTMAGGSVGAVAAAAAGAADYLTIPADTPAKRTGTTHALLNAGLIAMYGLNLLLRGGRKSPGAAPVLMSALGTVGLLVSAWYGGQLVYEHGLRVKGVDPIGDAPEARPPADKALTGALDAAGRAAPAGGPEADTPHANGAQEPAALRR